MSVQFILGRSGTGKTSYCIKTIVNALLGPGDGQPLILLVPEQATYQAERAILVDRRIAGYSRLNVLSFDRLQFLLSGKNTARPALSRIGRQMIVHRILRDNKSKLKVFGSSASWPGLGRQMAQTITELHQYAKTPDDIDQLLSELAKDERNNLASLKFADIGLILKKYLEFIEGKFIDPDIQLTQACGAVGTAGFVKGAKLWVDGFAGFTTAELAILTELLKAVADAQIALCLDPSNIDLANPDAAKLDPAGLFGPTERTYTALIEIIKKCKLQLAEPIMLDEAVRFSYLSQLGHIERNVFELQPEKMPTAGASNGASNIRIISAPNARAEVRFVARQILQLVKEKDYRYRDIAVIASDIERYEHYVRAYFDDYGVPFFIDKRKSLSQHAAIQLICSALQAVTGGFSHSDIFAYLKSDLVPIERCDVDVLENYCLAFGIGERDWTSGQEWSFAGDESDDFDEHRVNEIRLKAIGPLLELRERLCPGDNPAKKMSADEFVRAISDFLKALQVRQTINDWIKEAEKRKDETGADEHRQFYDKLIDIFDELVEVFAGQGMTCRDYVAILDSAFSQLTLAFIPPTLDQVLVGSIERSRHPDLKAVFLIGATQRQFPAPVRSDSILTDEDRGAAESADFALAAAASQMLAERQYLAYIAFTRPSEFLCVTYAITDDKGSAVPRSQFIDNLESLFENLDEESIAGEQIAIEKVHNERELADLLCSGLGKDGSRYSMLSTGRPMADTRYSLEVSHEQFSELLDDMCADEELTESGSDVLSAISYDNRAELDGDVVEKLFGEQIRSSATRLSTFAACPYQYFARYVLELKEREEFKLEPLDLGNFYHRVLDALLKKLSEENKDFATVEDKELLGLLSEQISKIVREDSFISNFARRSAHNTFIINSASEVLEDCVRAVAQMVRAGSYRPILSEVSFGEVRDTQDTLGKYELTLAGGRLLSLNGKIDRLDIAKLDGKEITVVLDYKRRGASFSWSKFYYGLDMQLPIYMLAVRNATDSKSKSIVGAFYMPVETVIGQAALDELSGKAEKFEYKAKGILNGEFFQQLDAATSSGWNKFYNFRISSKDGQYGDYGKSGALKPNDFEAVLEYAEKKIVELAGEIVSGTIDVWPYRLGTEPACSTTYCKYKSVCRFDWQVNEYNFLESLGKTKVLGKMSREGRGK